MEIKKKATQARGNLQQGIYAVINPFVRLLIRIGITPNIVTTIGMLGNIAAAAVLIAAGIKAQQGGGADFTLVTIAGALIIGFSLFDMLDGQVARIGGMASTFGAMYDSVLDRYCELFTLGGLAFYLIGCGNATGAILTFLALVGSIMVSYVRARAEGLDIECKIGFMQRPERVVVTSVAALAAGIILVVAMAIIAIFANMTAFARIAHCKRELAKKNSSAR